ncbi:MULTISPECIES: HopJ type III effector protein [Thalassotalea]|uniref:HopJ type III effector protein n=1 Tax=Thalassotalea castellviae TaxID=3075612 RepID=A0ABU3A2Z7_9GAMM|nr:HopJ type III effector protein [Thalassotalea sp. W431]MDT0604541.1 HopJ type III effector protein [Thalassotalea sp. W431]
MTLSIDALNSKLNASEPSITENITFEEVIAVISANYHYQPCTFYNGDIVNQAGTNEGSCKIFAYAQLNNLSEQATLHCFGQYYREDVLKNPTGKDHGNIRNFIKNGWPGITFEQAPLSLK